MRIYVILITGLNNFKIYTVKDVQYNKYFGVTDAEVREMLEYYGFMEKYSRRFIDKAKTTTRDELELLIDGGSVKKVIHQELTYRDLDSDIDNLWSILFTTGYLTQSGLQDGELTEFVIPNNEIRWIFVRQIREWFKEESVKDTAKLERK